MILSLLTSALYLDCAIFVRGEIHHRGVIKASVPLGFDFAVEAFF